MKNKRNYTTILTGIILGIFFSGVAHAQSGMPAVAQWQCFLPYNQVTGVATDGTTFFCATTAGFFTYNREDGALTPYSKANGMSDIGMYGVAYDKTTRQAILVYANSNIDLFKDNAFTNLPELKLSQGVGDKTVHHVTAHEGVAYLSGNMGILVLNLLKKEVRETIRFSKNSTDVPVYATTFLNDSIYAATGIGLFRCYINNPFLQFQSQWELLDSGAYRYLEAFDGNIYAASNDSLFRLNGNSVEFRKQERYAIRHLDAAPNGLWISTRSTVPKEEQGYAVLVDKSGARIDSFSTTSPRQVIGLANGDVWYGDDSEYRYPDKRGFRKKISATRSEPYFPDGPTVNTSFDVSAYNGELWVAHGGKDNNWNILKRRTNFSVYKDGHWHNYAWVSDNEWVQDFIRILKDQNTGKVYAASFSGGLLEMEPDGAMKVYGEGFLDKSRGSTAGNDSVPDNNLYQVSGLALDDDGNLWMTNFGAQQYELAVRTRDGKWPQLRSIASNSTHSAADIIIDDYGQKWFIAPWNEGAVVYNDNRTLDNANDDTYFVLRKGKGAGGLPESTTLSIVKDKEGAIWIGTTNGIGIVHCPGSVIARECEAELKVVQDDQFAGHLFADQSVKAMAVDGANRKWIGTSNGVWLISADAEKTIYRFTEDNSPLPSNMIERINIDPVTGDVFFSTEKGLACFRSTATEGYTKNEDELFIYPNPVPSGYGGMIAVRGIAENADVRFTDISGQLVYRTKALGGQAVWDGKDYTGRKVQSGVYLVFIVNKDGTEKATGKIIIHE